MADVVRKQFPAWAIQRVGVQHASGLSSLLFGAASVSPQKSLLEVVFWDFHWKVSRRMLHRAEWRAEWRRHAHAMFNCFSWFWKCYFCNNQFTLLLWQYISYTFVINCSLPRYFWYLFLFFLVQRKLILISFLKKCNNVKFKFVAPAEMTFSPQWNENKHLTGTIGCAWKQAKETFIDLLERLLTRMRSLLLHQRSLNNYMKIKCCVLALRASRSDSSSKFILKCTQHYFIVGLFSYNKNVLLYINWTWLCFESPFQAYE